MLPVVEHFGGVFSLVVGEPALLRLESVLAQFGELHFPESLVEDNRVRSLMNRFLP